MKKQIITACLIAMLSVPAHAEPNTQEIHEFCKITGNITYDAVRASLNGESRQTVQRKLEASYINPLPNDPRIRELMRAQVKHSLDKAYDLYPYLRRLPRSEHTKTSVAVGRIEYQVCMEQFLKHDNSKHRSDSHPA